MPRGILHRVFQSMGIPVHLTLVGVGETQADQLAASAFQVFDTFDKRFSRFRTDSELSALNNSAGQWFQASPELFVVIKKCLDLAKETGGVFDPSVGSVLASLGYGLPENYSFPNPVPTYEQAELNEREQKIKLARGQVLEPASIVKGMAIDSAATVLNSTKAFMINAGGDILTRGDYPEQILWRVGIQHPDDKQAIATTIEIRNEAVATSGTYEVKLQSAGKAWHHQIDMRAGKPVENIKSLTVIAKTAEEADTLASLGFLLGLEKGKAFLEKQSIPYLFIDDETKTHKNKLFVQRELV